MDITFSAANTVGLNNPGTEIITLVKDGGGNFINPPSYDKMRAYLRSGEVPMLFVTTEGGETGSLYQLDEYSETENKIRFSNSTNAIEFCAGCDTPVVSDVGGGGGYSDYEVLIDETITTDETGISAISYPELDFSQYNDIVIFFDRAMNTANSGQNLKISIKMLGYSPIYNYSVANPKDSYRSSIFRVLNMGNGNVASFACTADNQHNNPAQLYCCGIFPLNDPYHASFDNGFDLLFSIAYIGEIKLKILAK